MPRSDFSWIFPASQLMFFLFYAGNVCALLYYHYVSKHAPQWPAVKRHRVEMLTFTVCVLNTIPFGYQFITLLELGTRSVDEASVLRAQWPYLGVNGWFYAFLCIANFLGLVCAACGPNVRDDDTFEYMAFAHGYPADALKRAYAARGLQRFNVRGFEAWLGQRVSAGGPAADDKRRLVALFMAEETAAFNTAITWRNNNVCRAKYRELELLSDVAVNVEFVCEYDSIRLMREEKSKALQAE